MSPDESNACVAREWRHLTYREATGIGLLWLPIAVLWSLAAYAVYSSGPASDAGFRWAVLALLVHLLQMNIRNRGVLRAAVNKE